MIRILTTNLFWKFFSVAASIALWLALVGDTEVTTSVPVTVQYLNVPADLEISYDQLDRLFLKLRGPAAQMKAEHLQATTLSINLERAQAPGERSFAITEDILDLPAGVHLEKVVPSHIRIFFDRRFSKQVPVELQLSGSPPAGYRIASQQLSPSSVRITGPERRVRQVAFAQTDAVDLGSTVGEAQFKSAAFLSDPQVRFEGSPPSILVRVRLERVP